MRPLFIAFLFILSVSPTFAQDKFLLTGIRLQKTHNLYYENGVTFDYTQQKYLNTKIYIGFSYVTSRLGTALNSNAIKQDNYLIQVGYHFRKDKIICPVLQLNTGYFYADYGSPIFDVLPHSSMLLSFEPGIFLNFKYPVKSKLSLGYNFITGNGTSGPGTLFPLFFQCSIYYQFNLKENK
jgi:hypothetical protein